MSRKQDANQVIFEEMVALVEKASRAVEHLQLEIKSRDERIDALEKSKADLEKDAYWCRWFRRQYGHTSFFSAVEAAFRAAHGGFAKSMGAEKTAAGSSPFKERVQD